MSDYMSPASLQPLGGLVLTQAVSPKLGAGSDVAVVDKKSKDFEGMFLSQMLQPMFEGVAVDPVFGGGHGEEIMRTLLVQEYGKIMSKSSHIGIADSVKKEMIRAQGINPQNRMAGNTSGLNMAPLPISLSSTPVGGIYNVSQ